MRVDFPMPILLVAAAAQARPGRNGFAVTPGQGHGTVASVWSSAGAEVSWQGPCLEDAIFREKDLQNRPEDDRAGEIFRAPALLARWRACYRSAPAEACLDRLLPISTDSMQAGPPLTARCRLEGVERENGALNFHCEGTLVEAECNSMANVVFSADGAISARSAPGFRPWRPHATVRCSPMAAAVGITLPGFRSIHHRLPAYTMSHRPSDPDPVY